MRVHVFFLGGTISMTPDPGATGGVRPRLGSADLLGSLPLPAGVVTTGVDFRSVGSSHLTYADVLDLRAAAAAAVQGGADGVVVVQGTDSLEETAFLLDLLWEADAPVVLTGAMRHPGLAGPDGAANLTAAISVAADPAWRGLGVLAVLGDEVHAARFVAKQHTSLPDAFGSPEAGPLGRLLEGRAVPATTVVRRPALPAPASMPARIAVHTAAIDDDPGLVALVAGTADGLVVAGFGAGHVRPPVADVLAAAVGRIPVVLASRTGAGSVHTSTYGGPGSEQDLLARGLISAHRLPPLKARLLLAVLLGNGAAPLDRAALTAAFTTYG